MLPKNVCVIIGLYFANLQKRISIQVMGVAFMLTIIGVQIVSFKDELLLWTFCLQA